MRFRFPGSTSARGGKDPPPGWRWHTLGDILVKIESGNRPRGGSVPGGVPSVGAENVMGIGQYDFRKEKYVPDAYFRVMPRGVVVDRDVLIYKDGAHIGRSSYFGDGFPHAKCAVNEHVFLVRTIPEVGQNLLYFWLFGEDNRQRIRNLNANTAQPGVSRSKLKTLPFLKPPVAIVRAFDRVVEPAVRQIFGLAKQQRTLVAARDAMLPRLMSGEIAA